MTKKNYKVISVESRKGGVGKTTAALNIGYLLKDRCHVLLLDIDITGTSIKAVQESRFWVKDTCLLLGTDGNPINLLQYYTNSFLKGKKLFSFSTIQEPEKVLVYDGIVNVIASELYGEDASLLYDPSLLLDNLHVYWLTKLITSIIDKFSICFKDDKPCVIILDNSPGFVGIGKAVHDILTDMGPEIGKFLTVSSLDTQDVDSSLKSVYALHQEYLDKWNGAHFPETNKGDENFYARVQLSGAKEFAYYRKKQAEARLSSYQGLIINKVAKSIIDGRTQYDFKKKRSPELEKVYDALYEEQIKEYIVPFDNILLTQFYGLFNEKVNEPKQNLSKLKKRLSTIETQINNLNKLPPKTLTYDLLRRAEGFENSIDALKGVLIASGYEVIASKFNPEWFPLNSLRRVISIMEDRELTPENIELYIPERTVLFGVMEDYFPRLHNLIRTSEDYSIDKQKTWLVSAVLSIACEFSLINSRSSLSIVFPDRYYEDLDAMLCHWVLDIIEEYQFVRSDKLSLAAFVISKEALRKDFILRKLFGSNITVYFKLSVCRLMDLSSDMQALVTVIRAITVDNEGSFSLDVDYVPLLDQKIVEKKYDYYQLKEMMYKELRDADYMDAFRKVLGRVVQNWSI